MSPGHFLTEVRKGASAQIGRAGRLVPEVGLGTLGPPAAEDRQDGTDHGEQENRTLGCHANSSLADEQGVGLGGLEPPASSLSGMRSNQLSYRPQCCGTAFRHGRRDYTTLSDIT